MGAVLRLRAGFKEAAAADMGRPGRLRERVKSSRVFHVPAKAGVCLFFV